MQPQSDYSYINHELVERAAESVISRLASWANASVFGPHQGKLEYQFPLLGAPNACISGDQARPWHRTILISLEMLLRMYRDAFVYPIAAKRIESESDVISAINATFDDAGIGNVAFSTGIPVLPCESLVGPISQYASAFAEAVESQGDSRITRNDVNFRFLIFELMLTWTFFHELSHHLQQHYLLDGSEHSIQDGAIIQEEISQGDAVDHSLHRQAREILADAEGLNLTISLLKQSGRFQFPAMYALLCSVGCMFQCFFEGYSSTSLRAIGSHPHPVIRDEFIGRCWIKLISSCLVLDQVLLSESGAAAQLAYMSVRASTITALIRSQRASEQFDTPLPSYMHLQSEHNQEEFDSCVSEIKSAIDREAFVIKSLHLCPGLFSASLSALLDPFAADS
jgi:hypothetical protein